MEKTEPVIVKCEIGPFPRPMPEGIFDSMPQVLATFSDGTQNILFDFYPDEISFTEKELIGLTEPRARDLRHLKDMKFLQS